MTMNRAERLLLVVLSVPAFVAGCDGSGSSETTGTGPVGQKATCELTSRTEITDADELMANGQSGALLLAAVPDSLQTTLHWDLSTSGVEVEVPGSVGLSTPLDLSFTLPAAPQFFYEDWIVVYPPGDVLDVEVICDDYVTTSVDAILVTEDGTISTTLTGLTARLGPDDPQRGYVAKPLVYETVDMASPAVNFVSPEALPANPDKIIGFLFDGQVTQGSITIFADGSSETYRQQVARW